MLNAWLLQIESTTITANLRIYSSVNIFQSNFLGAHVPKANTQES